MHHAMPNCGKCIISAAFLEPIHQGNSLLPFGSARPTYGKISQNRLLKTWRPAGRSVQFSRPTSGVGSSPASNSANLMLDEPPLIVRMCELAGFMDDSFVICNPNEASFAHVDL